MKPITMFVFCVALIGGIVLLSMMFDGANETMPRLAEPAPETKTEQPDEKLKNDGSSQGDGLVVSKTGPHPVATTSEEKFDFGSMEQGGSAEHEFVIRNEGEGPLQILAKPNDSSCSQCTVGSVSTTEPIPPGQTATVKVKWTIKTESEQFRHWAAVVTNDPKRRRIEFVVEGTIRKVLDRSPDGVWNVGDCSSREPKKFKGFLGSAILDKFAILSSNRPAEELKWTALEEEALKERNWKCGYSIDLTIPPEKSLGSFYFPVRLETDARDGIKVDFVVNGQREANIAIRGIGWSKNAMKLSMGEFPATVGKEMTMSLYLKDNETLKIKDMKQRFNSLEINLAKDDQFDGVGQRYVLTCKVPAGKPAQHLGMDVEVVSIKLIHPEIENLEFSVEYLALPK